MVCIYKLFIRSDPLHCRCTGGTVHFIEYGILSGLIYIALTHDIHNNVYVYFFTVFIVFIFGAVDEVSQLILLTGNLILEIY